MLQWLSGAQALPEYADLFYSRAKEFYELASEGWDTTLCAGGMLWSPYLQPYKNAVTNELYIAASIGMYLHHPEGSKRHLEAAVKAHRWLSQSGMRNEQGLYCDGFHMTHRRCTDLNRMLYTYNQGILLSALRGLFDATKDELYVMEAVQLVEDMRSGEMVWDGVVEEKCDPAGFCNQDGQMFKGIYFLHLQQLCKDWSNPRKGNKLPKLLTEKCGDWKEWVKGNMDAALRSRSKAGIAGMWWNAPSGSELNLDLKIQRPGIAASSLDGAVRDLVNQCAGDVEECEIAMRPPGEQRWGYGKGDWNDRGRGRTVETHGGLIGVILAARELGV